MLKRIFVIGMVAIGLMAGGCSQKPATHPPSTQGKSAPVVTTLAPTTTTTVPPTTTTTAPPTPMPVEALTAPPADLTEAWSRVAQCESGGWVVLGSVYPNSLGLTAQNWQAFGGTSDVSVEAQIAVAERFRAAYGIPIPDQNGCAPW